MWLGARFVLVGHLVGLYILLDWVGVEIWLCFAGELVLLKIMSCFIFAGLEIELGWDGLELWLDLSELGVRFGWVSDWIVRVDIWLGWRFGWVGLGWFYALDLAGLNF